MKTVKQWAVKQWGSETVGGETVGSGTVGCKTVGGESVGPRHAAACPAGTPHLAPSWLSHLACVVDRPRPHSIKPQHTNTSIHQQPSGYNKAGRHRGMSPGRYRELSLTTAMLQFGLALVGVGLHQDRNVLRDGTPNAVDSHGDEDGQILSKLSTGVLDKDVGVETVFI